MHIDELQCRPIHVNMFVNITSAIVLSKAWNDLPSDTDITSIGTFRSILRRFNLLVCCDKDYSRPV